MRGRVADTAKGLLALAAGLATLAGPPLALATFVGNPLPASVPSWVEFTNAVGRSGVPDSTVIDALAVLAWIIWIQIAIALVIETVAVVRGRQAARLPIVPGLQPLASRWLATAALVLTALTSNVPSTAAALAPLPVAHRHDPVTSTDVAEPPPQRGATARDQGDPQQNAPEVMEYVVQRHDSFWDIADRFIGDPFRWREVRDLNVGRPQPDGGSVEPGSDLIRPGWRLLVHASNGAAPSPATPSSTSDRVVRAGDHLWSIAEQTMTAHLGRASTDEETRTYWQSLIEMNRARLADPSNPSLLLPGQDLMLPPLPQPATPAMPSVAPGEDQPAPPASLPGSGPVDEPVPTTAPTTVPTTAGLEVPDRRSPLGGPAAAAEQPEAGAPAPVAGLLGIAGTGIAVGVATAVRRRRKQRLAQAPAGFAPPPMPDQLDDVAIEVAVSADLDAAGDLRRAMAAAASHVASTGAARRRRPRLVQVAPDRIEVLLDEPALPAPPGWEPEASGAVWSCSRPAAGDARVAASPTLVTVGSDDSTQVLLDLESAGLLTIGGEPNAAAALMRSLLLELENSALADVAAIVVIGDIAHVESDRVRYADAWDDVAHDVLAWARQSRQVLAANRIPTAFAARGCDRALDGLAPLVVFCERLPGSPTFDEFCSLATEGAAASAVVLSADPHAVGTHIEIVAGSATIPALGLTCRAQGVEPDLVVAVGELLDAAERPAEQATLFDDQPNTGPAATGDYQDPAWDVLVRVLGEIGVVGGRKPLTPKQTGLFTYVALHDSCSVDRIEEAIWPGPMESRRRQVHNTVSQIRAALGPEHLPAAEGSQYRAGPRVRTDLDLFRRRVAYAASQPPSSAIETLRGALALVEGPAFSYRSADRASFVWVDIGHWTSDTEAKIVDVAWKLWHLCTEHDDQEGAILAARQGLLASPANTELTEALMRAYVAADDRGAAEGVFRSHAKALDELNLDDPAPSTLQLWEQIQDCDQRAIG